VLGPAARLLLLLLPRWLRLPGLPLLALELQQL
jgi:hypothetical protein